MSDMIKSILLLSLWLICGCIAQAPNKKANQDECKTFADCQDGYECLEQKCAAPCLTQGDCHQDTQACIKGYCLSRISGEAPVIASVKGNDPTVPVQIKDGFIVSGSGLKAAEFELAGGSGETSFAVPLASKAQNDSIAEVVWSDAEKAALPKGVHQGTYKIQASNRSGSSSAAVTLLLPDYSSDELITNINKATDSKLNTEVLPEVIQGLVARMDALEKTAIIKEDMSKNVSSGNCSDIISTIDSIAMRPIAPGVTVTINVSGGPYTCEQPLNFALVNGDRVRFVGGNNGGLVELNFPSSTGITIGQGYKLGYLNGFKLVGNNTVSARGIFVKGGSVYFGENLEITSFGLDGALVEHYGSMQGGKLYTHDNAGSGVLSQLGGLFRAGSGTEASKNGYSGFFARLGGNIFIECSEAKCAVASYNIYHGYYAESDSKLMVYNSYAYKNGASGYHAYSAKIFAGGALAEDNTSIGFNAYSGAMIDAQSATSRGNYNGFQAQDHSYINAISTTSIKNQHYGFQVSVRSMITSWRAILPASPEEANLDSDFNITPNDINTDSYILYVAPPI
ncbi:MAG: hypothetical protein JW841_09725 [Deltaproteobacteria bacterium]|nr:hypothetical protein [Deltaproteobacteria bacterium]